MVAANRRGGRSGVAASNRRFGFGMALPSMIVLVLLLVVPTLLTISYSLRDNAVSGDLIGGYVGLRNYRVVFDTPLFWQSLRVTTIFAVGFVLSSTVVGLAVALLLNQQFFGRPIARALLILPWASPWLVIGIMWNRFAGDTNSFGLANVLIHLHLIDRQTSVLATPSGALVLLIIAAAWRQSCFAAILFLGGLQTLPGELMEAAAIDGAGAWNRFRHVTLPWLRPVLITVTVLNVVYGFLQFDIVYSLTQGGPGASTELLSMLIYQTLFTNTHIGTGSALSVVLSLLALVSGLVAVRLLYRQSEV